MAHETDYESNLFRTALAQNAAPFDPRLGSVPGQFDRFLGNIPANGRPLANPPAAATAPAASIPRANPTHAAPPPMLFRSSAGPSGAFNMGAMTAGDRNFTPTDQQGVPLGQAMVPVQNVPGAEVGVQAGGRFDPNAGPAIPFATHSQAPAGMVPPNMDQFIGQINAGRTFGPITGEPTRQGPAYDMGVSNLQATAQAKWTANATRGTLTGARAALAAQEQQDKQMQQAQQGGQTAIGVAHEQGAAMRERLANTREIAGERNATTERVAQGRNETAETVANTRADTAEQRNKVFADHMDRVDANHQQAMELTRSMQGIKSASDAHRTAQGWAKLADKEEADLQFAPEGASKKAAQARVQQYREMSQHAINSVAAEAPEGQSGTAAAPGGISRWARK